MQILNRRRSAILLIILGLVLLGFGIWIIASMFISKTPEQQPTQNNVYQKPAPQTYSAPVKISGTSTVPVNAKASDLQEAAMKASSVVSRMGSGTSADGFLGFSDVMIDGTEKFKGQMLSSQRDLQQLHPATGPLFGVTTRVISYAVVAGKNGDNEFTVAVSAQRAEDAGDRSRPASVTYLQYMVNLVKQDANMLVDSISEKQITQ